MAQDLGRVAGTGLGFGFGLGLSGRVDPVSGHGLARIWATLP